MTSPETPGHSERYEMRVAEQTELSLLQDYYYEDFEEWERSLRPTNAVVLEHHLSVFGGVNIRHYKAAKEVCDPAAFPSADPSRTPTAQITDKLQTVVDAQSKSKDKLAQHWLDEKKNGTRKLRLKAVGVLATRIVTDTSIPEEEIPTLMEAAKNAVDAIDPVASKFWVIGRRLKRLQKDMDNSNVTPRELRERWQPRMDVAKPLSRRWGSVRAKFSFKNRHENKNADPFTNP